MPSAVPGAAHPQKLRLTLHPSWEPSSSCSLGREDPCSEVWGAGGGSGDPGYVCFLNSSPSRSYFSSRCPLTPRALGCQALGLRPSPRVHLLSAQPSPASLGLGLPGLPGQGPRGSPWLWFSILFAQRCGLTVFVRNPSPRRVSGFRKEHI